VPTTSISRCGGAATPTTLAEEAISDPQLFAFYRLSESSGTVVGDSGPGALHMAATGTPVWGGAAGPPGEQTAVFAADWTAFRGTGFITLAAGDMTAEVWVKRTDTVYMPFIGVADPLTSFDGWALGAYDVVTQPPGYAFVGAGDGVSRNGVNGSVTPITVGPWFYLATTRISDVWRLYVNGVQEPGTVTQATNAQPAFRIGGVGPFPAKAQVSYVVVRSRGLSSAEILSNYHLAVP
jgi:hypothetical protein